MLCGVFSNCAGFSSPQEMQSTDSSQGLVVLPTQNGNCLILRVFLNALLVLTKMNICCMNDVSKQEREGARKRRE